MFSWFRPKLSLDSEAKRWIEARLWWLKESFGQEYCIARDIVLPTSEYFPDPYDGSESSVRRLLNRVCHYMDVDKRHVNLQLYTNKPPLWLVDARGHYLPPGSAGTFQSFSGYCVISIETSQLLEPMELVGTIAHELAHYRLLSENRLRGDEYDHELLTDLATVFHGLGIFLGNRPRNWNSSYSSWPGTSHRKPEYMTLPMYAYALAHQAWWRGQLRPKWCQFMNSDLYACFKPATRYLFETSDSTFPPEKLA